MDFKIWIAKCWKRGKKKRKKGIENDNKEEKYVVGMKEDGEGRVVNCVFSDVREVWDKEIGEVGAVRVIYQQKRGNKAGVFTREGLFRFYVSYGVRAYERVRLRCF